MNYLQRCTQILYPVLNFTGNKTVTELCDEGKKLPPRYTCVFKPGRTQLVNILFSRKSNQDIGRSLTIRVIWGYILVWMNQTVMIMVPRQHFLQTGCWDVVFFVLALPINATITTMSPAAITLVLDHRQLQVKCPVLISWCSISTITNNKE